MLTCCLCSVVIDEEDDTDADNVVCDTCLPGVEAVRDFDLATARERVAGDPDGDDGITWGIFNDNELQRDDEAVAFGGCEPSCVKTDDDVVAYVRARLGLASSLSSTVPPMATTTTTTTKTSRRKKRDNKTTRGMSLAHTAEEWAALQALADADGATINVVISNLIRERIARRAAPEALRDAARDRYGDPDDIEIGDVVDEADGGSWISARLWVPND